jgi:hypothetical protein
MTGRGNFRGAGSSAGIVKSATSGWLHYSDPRGWLSPLGRAWFPQPGTVSHLRPIAWPPPMGNTFQVPDRFGTFKLVDAAAVTPQPGNMARPIISRK